MRSAALPAREDQRLEAIREFVCAYAPREERFDRLTRLVRLLMNVPVALLTIVEADEQWFRSVQGLEVDHTPRDISFCAHVVATGHPLIIGDTWADADFLDNPLVTGPPGIRSYAGWPLQIAPGLVAGSLCAIDTIPRQFDGDELMGLKELAAIAESELRAHAEGSVQRQLLMRMDLMQRRHALDPETGCWTIRGFRELLGLAVPQAQAERGALALCVLQVQGIDEAAAALGPHAGRAMAMSVLAQLLRERLPPEAALARLADGSFCALVTAPNASLLDATIAPLVLPEVEGVLPRGERFAVRLTARVVRLATQGPGASAAGLWAAALIGTAA
jgi:GGDEF domain-containing protein